MNLSLFLKLLKMRTSSFLKLVEKNTTMRNLTSDINFNSVFPCNYYSIIIFLPKKKTTCPIQNLTKLSPNYPWSVSSQIKNNHRNRLSWYWVIRLFVAHISNANLRLMWFSQKYHCQKWTKLCKFLGPKLVLYLKPLSSRSCQPRCHFHS